MKRLSSLVDEFEKPFHPDPLVLKDYKKVSLTAALSLLQPLNLIPQYIKALK